MFGLQKMFRCMEDIKIDHMQLYWTNTAFFFHKLKNNTIAEMETAACK